MGEIVSAAVVGHVPTVMLEEDVRRRLGGSGQDTTLVEGYRRLRAHFEAKAVDCWVIFDTHWFTTTEHVIAGPGTIGASTPPRSCPGSYTSSRSTTRVRRSLPKRSEAWRSNDASE